MCPQMEHKYKIHLYVHIIAKTSRSIALLKKFNSQKGYLLLPMFIKRYINQTQPLTLEQDQPWFFSHPQGSKAHRYKNEVCTSEQKASLQVRSNRSFSTLKKMLDEAKISPNFLATYTDSWRFIVLNGTVLR